MDIIASVILIPFIVSIITNRVDAVLFAPIIEELLKRFQQDEKQLSHELKKSTQNLSSISTSKHCLGMP
ncbi:MAG: hypothetical protein C4323_06135 [Mastigocladus sp. ERB_26_2]